MTTGRVVSINVSDGGVPKLPVAAATVTAAGVEGDRQRDRRNHGGPERAVSLFSSEVIDALAAEGHPVRPGSTGENLTLSGLRWSEIVPGAELTIGAVRLVVTKYTSPCHKIAASFEGGEFVRISQELHPGRSRVYARVLEGGLVRVGDEVTVARRAGSSPRS
jgi:MOSC domain-containing protein YiiM